MRNITPQDFVRELDAVALEAATNLLSEADHQKIAHELYREAAALGMRDEVIHLQFQKVIHS